MTGLYQDVYHDTYGDAMSVCLGLDVSSYQGSVNWGAVAKTPYRFALARLTIGRGTKDTQGRTNLKAMANTMPVAGAYGVVGVAEPVEDGASLLLDEIAVSGVDPAKILVMLDAENFSDGSHPTIDQVDRYARRIHSELGRWPIAYVPGWWLSQHGYTVTGRGLANCPWAPSHYLQPPWDEQHLQANKPSDLRGFKSLAWLQYTSKASASGITGNVDANCFYGTLDQLKARLLGQETDMTGEEHDALMWLRNNATLLRDQGVRMTDHGDPDVAGRGNNLAAVREDIAALKQSIGQLSPQQLVDLGQAIANALSVKGVSYSISGTLDPKVP